MKRFSLLAVQKDRKSLVLPDVSDVRVRKVTERQLIVCQAQDSKRSEANKKDFLERHKIELLQSLSGTHAPR